MLPKHLRFDYQGQSVSGLTSIWKVFNNDNESYLGNIKWAGNFRKYAFYPEDNCLFDVECLRDIANKLNELMEQRSGIPH